jgi:Asp-tRNA(Asn)/Glu-tRNA(Gln) amidotransferase A subunit family amidase
MTAPWRLGVAELSAALAAGEITSREATQSALDRIAATEPSVHAWAFVAAEAALAEADASDARRRRGERRGPADGIPIGVKDVIDVAGMPTRAGSASLAHAAPARKDARAVRNYRTAGGIILGKTHTYEFAFGQGHPPPRNPRDPARYAGGSSIGSGVAVAVGAAPAALGTDTGGSIRNPAAVNGLVGAKPTAGVVSLDGVLPISDTMDAVGPIAGSVSGCAIMLDAIAEPDVLAERFKGSIAARAAEHDGRLRVGVDPAMWDNWAVCGGVRDTLLHALAELSGSADVEVVSISAPEIDHALTAGLVVSLSESVAHHRDRLAAVAADYLPGTRVMIATGALLDPSDVATARAVGRSLTARLEGRLRTAGLDAIVSPTLPAIAPLLSSMASELTAADDGDALGSALRMLSVANLTGLPGISVPCGEVSGMPVGMHLLGRRFGEPTLLALAGRQEARSAWQERVPLDPRGPRKPSEA